MPHSSVEKQRLSYFPDFSSNDEETIVAFVGAYLALFLLLFL
jgi:hypothetical protein